MKKIDVPEGYQQLMPYLIFENAQAFFGFTAAVFGATEKHRDMRDENILRHGEISINGSIVMFADAIEDYPPHPAGMFLYVDDCDAVYKRALANGATMAGEPTDREYGRAAGFNDPFGNTWWITSV